MSNASKKKLSKVKTESFQQFIWDFYKKNGRPFAWRNIEDPYCVVVSEIMLQQTKKHRVEKKYDAFIEAFPTFKDLAEGSLRDVLSLWQGLGYNRRAKALYTIAQKVMNEFDGVLLQSPEILQTFPGIGAATAGSICAFAFNMPTVFIETNVRAVFLHHFFAHKEGVKDQELFPLIAQAVDQDNPREWYYALMDYGVMLKKQHANPNKRSAHYTTQSKFEGSDRQIRGIILKLLTTKSSMSFVQLASGIDREPQRIEKILKQLCGEQFIQERKNTFSIV